MAANSYLLQQQQQHNQQFYQGTPDMSRNGATPNSIARSNMSNPEYYVPYQPDRASISLSLQNAYQPNQYPQQQRPLRLKKDK